MTDAPERTPLTGWIRFLGVIFRLLIILGLLLFAAAVVLVLLTDLIPYWTVFFPVALVLMGILLARVEYRLHQRTHKGQ